MLVAVFCLSVVDDLVQLSIFNHLINTRVQEDYNYRGEKGGPSAHSQESHIISPAIDRSLPHPPGPQLWSKTLPWWVYLTPTAATMARRWTLKQRVKMAFQRASLAV